MKVKDQVKLFKNIIENEYKHIQNTEIEDIENSYLEYGVHTEKKVRIMEKLKEIVSDEVFQLISELDDTNTEIAYIEQRYYFKEGVKAGIDNLNFLSEYQAKMLL